MERLALQVRNQVKIIKIFKNQGEQSKVPLRLLHVLNIGAVLWLLSFVLWSLNDAPLCCIAVAFFSFGVKFRGRSARLETGSLKKKNK